jgi:hypothetical protein
MTVLRFTISMSSILVVASIVGMDNTGEWVLVPCEDAKPAALVYESNGALVPFDAKWLDRVKDHPFLWLNKLGRDHPLAVKIEITHHNISEVLPCLRPMYMLTELDLSQNQIADFDFGIVLLDCPAIKKISLAYNPLTTFTWNHCNKGIAVTNELIIDVAYTKLNAKDLDTLRECYIKKELWDSRQTQIISKQERLLTHVGSAAVGAVGGAMLMPVLPGAMQAAAIGYCVYQRAHSYFHETLEQKKLRAIAYNNILYSS